jgi:uncharacterized membrane protein
VSWTAVLAVLFAAVLLYPLTATQAKIEDRWVPTAPEGLDGMAFMELATYADNNQNEVLRYDYDALRWIQDNLPGSPVIAEAPAGPSGNPGLYHWASRVATYTGNPTIVGWDWHQRQQRAAASEDVVGRRTQDAMQLFVTPDPRVALEIARQYDVEYIYVGPVETVFYPAESLAKFERMAADGTLRLVYQNDGVRLYQIVAGE